MILPSLVHVRQILPLLVQQAIHGCFFGRNLVAAASSNNDAFSLALSEAEIVQRLATLHRQLVLNNDLTEYVFDALKLKREASDHDYDILTNLNCLAEHHDWVQVALR